MDLCTLTKESKEEHPAVIEGVGHIHQIPLCGKEKRSGEAGEEGNPSLKE